MNATITKISAKPSKYGGICFLITFKEKVTGKSLRTWAYDNCGNFKNWKPIIDAGVGSEVGNLRIKGGFLVDADSMVTILNNA